jgi:hypothetical protein
MRLSFLKADTGEVCPVGDTQWETGFDDGLREHFAWLPDGRLLYVPASGDMTILSPCEPDSVSIDRLLPCDFHPRPRLPRIQRTGVAEKPGLLLDLDGNSMEATSNPNVTPNPFEASLG